MKRVIGLCGGSGAGKSTVARMLEDQGAERIDADMISREISAPGGGAYDALREAFPEYFDACGELMRKRLGGAVFTDPEALAKLESITHPAMREEMLRRIEASTREKVILDCAILDRPVFRDLADEIWFIDAPREERLRRIMLRDGLTEEEAGARLSAQNEQALRSIADHVIDNSGPLEIRFPELSRTTGDL